MTIEPLSFLPLTEPTFYILLSLAPGKKHGYAILKDVKNLSRERVNMSTSTLYTAVGRLLDQKLIERLSEDGDDDQVPLAQILHITELGRHVLEAEMVLAGYGEKRLRLRRMRETEIAVPTTVVWCR
jgi:DNA-binding PadR family transcriptional regulator